jgi:hypothetical protein
MSDQHTARKLRRLDQILRDPRATHLDFRVAYYIGSVTDRARGEARFKQGTAADALGVTRRAIQQSTERLRALRHININFAPGRGHLNGYSLCKTINIATTRGITSADQLPSFFAPHNETDETVAITTPRRSQ